MPVGACSRKWRADDAAQVADFGEEVRNLLPVGFVSRCLYAQSAAVISRPIAHFGAPVLIGQVPIDGLCQALFHVVSWAPTQLGADAVWVNCVAAVMAWPVSHRRDQIRVGS